MRPVVASAAVGESTTCGLDQGERRRGDGEGGSWELLAGLRRGAIVGRISQEHFSAAQFSETVIPKEQRYVQGLGEKQR